MQDVISQHVKQIQAKQNELIKERLTVILGYELNLEDEAKRRFPRIGIFQDATDQSTHYYWNDGSIDGIRIISFYKGDINFDKIDDGKISANFNYR